MAVNRLDAINKGLDKHQKIVVHTVAKMGGGGLNLVNKQQLYSNFINNILCHQ
jgi:hypothetical protein